MKSYLTKVCKNIKRYRIESGMTLPQAAKKAGISKGNLSKIENGPCNVGLETLHKLAKALGISLRNFLP